MNNKKNNKTFGMVLLGFNIVIWIVVGMIVSKNIKVNKYVYDDQKNN
jgi:uncharacterized membrane-anchored protein YitT (DUF2179 family)